jgi:hypothetical protein
MDEVEGERAATEDAAVDQEATGATNAEHALVALRSGWGDGYRVGCDDSGWWYERRDGKGGRQEGVGPDDVARMIADDHAFMPVQGRGDRDGTAGFLTAGQRRGVFEVDEASALAELELAWDDGGYHGFSVDDGLWSAISSAGDVLTGDTPDALTRRIRAHWQAMQ